MGTWIGALGRLTVVPEPDERLLLEYIDFSIHTCPDGYARDEVFSNSWFFDINNKLISGIGKFAEPSVWYKCIKTCFFEARGYQLCGDPEFVGEFDLDLWELGRERESERIVWKQRVREIIKDLDDNEEYREYYLLY